jgi:Tripartite tricarboxylate transporter family receptor
VQVAGAANQRRHLTYQVFAFGCEIEETAAPITRIRPLLNDALPDELADLDRDELTRDIHELGDLAHRHIGRLSHDHDHVKLRIVGANVTGKLVAVALHLIEEGHQFEDQPEVPTIAEIVPGLTAIAFVSLAAPAGTPGDVVRRLNEALNQTLETTNIKQRFAELSMPIKIMTPEETKSFVENEEKLWWPMVRELDLK